MLLLLLVVLLLLLLLLLLLVVLLLLLLTLRLVLTYLQAPASCLRKARLRTSCSTN